MLLAFILWAADEAQQPGKDGTAGLAFNILLFGGIFFLFWLIVMRPARRQEAERQKLLSQLEKNDRVLTNAGIYGYVVSVSDKEDEVTIKIDDNVKVKMVRGSIARNLTKEDKLAQQELTQKETASAERK